MAFGWQGVRRIKYNTPVIRLHVSIRKGWRQTDKLQNFHQTIAVWLLGGKASDGLYTKLQSDDCELGLALARRQTDKLQNVRQTIAVWLLDGKASDGSLKT